MKQITIGFLGLGLIGGSIARLHPPKIFPLAGLSSTAVERTKIFCRDKKTELSAISPIR